VLIAQAMQNFRAREAQVFQQIARVLGQAAAMRVHVPDRDFARDPRIKHRKCGIEDAQF
jgi:hypothetical protein